MVAVAAIFTTYQLTPTRRSRGQVIDVQWLNPLRIRKAQQPHTFLRLRQLLIRILIRIPHLFRTYIRICLPLTFTVIYVLLPALLPPPFTCLPFKLYLYSPHSTYLYDLRDETGATLFRRSWGPYIRIYILIRPTYRCRCGTPG